MPLSRPARIVLLAFACALAACGGEPDEDPPADDPEPADTDTTDTGTAPTGGTTDTGPTTDTDTGASPGTATLPDPGSWGFGVELVASTCAFIDGAADVDMGFVDIAHDGSGGFGVTFTDLPSPPTLPCTVTGATFTCATTQYDYVDPYNSMSVRYEFDLAGEVVDAEHLRIDPFEIGFVSCNGAACAYLQPLPCSVTLEGPAQRVGP